MKQRLLALADKQVREGDRAGTIETINALYALVDAEGRVKKLLRQRETVVASESSLSSEKQFHSIGVDLGRSSMAVSS